MAAPRAPLARFLVSLLVGAVAIGAGFTWLYPPASTDRVTTAERQARQEAFARLDTVQLIPIANSDAAAALDDMQLPPADRAKLQAILNVEPSATDHPATSARTNSTAAMPMAKATFEPLLLTRVTLWDTHAEDGDVVAILSAGYRREVRITNGMQQVTLPVRPGVSMLQIIGIHDGGGGITLGVEATGGRALMPIMAEGQTLSVPVQM